MSEQTIAEDAGSPMDLACALLRVGRDGEAMDIADRWLSVQPDSAQAHFLSGWMALHLGRPEAALAHLGNASLIDPVSPIPAGLRTVILSQLGHHEQARRSLDEMVLLHAAMYRGITRANTDALAGFSRIWRDFRADAKRRLGLSPDQPVNFVFLSGGLGDQYFCGSFLKAKREAEPDVPLVAVMRPNADWAGMLPGSADLFLSMEPGLVDFARLVNRCAPDHPYVPASFWWLGCFLNVYTMPQTTRAIMGVPKDAVMQPPTVTDEARTAALGLFAAKGGVAGRSVLVSDLSNSNKMIGDEWWAAAVEALTRAGLVVFQNVVNMIGQDSRTTLPNAIPVEIPMTQVIPFVEEAGHFIGIRSGLCDLLGYADAKMICIHVPNRTMLDGNYPLPVWLRADRGFGISQSFSSSRWRDVELLPSASFDSSVFADWHIA